MTEVSGLSPELLPCPFCGAHGEELGMRQPQRATPYAAATGWNVRCYVCHVETAYEDSGTEAVAAWNRRQEPTPPTSCNTQAPVPEGERERVARIIDPRAWELRDAAGFKRYAPHEDQIARSLEKADAILTGSPGGKDSPLRACEASAAAVENRLDDGQAG